jgi:hypothetical protein
MLFPRNALLSGPQAIFSPEEGIKKVKGGKITILLTNAFLFYKSKPSLVFKTRCSPQAAIQKMMENSDFGPSLPQKNVLTKNFNEAG